MNIISNPIISKAVNNPKARKAIGTLCSSNALAPVVFLEATVMAGRTYQAKQRGGWIEARERFTEESLTAVVWLFGIKYLNKAFDFMAKKTNTFKDITVDVGQDHGRAPFKHLLSKKPNVNGKLLSYGKFGKIAAAAGLAVYLVGSVIPKLNHEITQKALASKRNKKQTNNTPKKEIPRGFGNKIVPMNTFLNRCKNGVVSFTNGEVFANMLRKVAHNVENHDIVRMLTVDVGVSGGRAIHARNADERNEILFRDMASIYFYLASTPHISKFLANNADKFRGKNTNIAPEVAARVGKLIKAELAKNPDADLNKITKVLFGDRSSEFIQNLQNKVMDRKTIKLDDFKATFGDIIKKEFPHEPKKAEAILEQAYSKATKYAKEINFVNDDWKFITVEQISDIFSNGKIHDQKFVRSYYNAATGGQFDNPEKFISQKELVKIRQTVSDFTETVLDEAKHQGQKITTKLVDTMTSRSIIRKFGYTMAGLGISSLFLSTIIPKVQYFITKIRTGESGFPGVKDIKN